MSRRTEVVPTLQLAILGRDVERSNVSLLVTQPAGDGRYRDGVLAMDGLGGGFTLDFRRMQLRLDWAASGQHAVNSVGPLGRRSPRPVGRCLPSVAGFGAVNPAVTADWLFHTVVGRRLIWTRLSFLTHRSGLTPSSVNEYITPVPRRRPTSGSPSNSIPSRTKFRHVLAEPPNERQSKPGCRSPRAVRSRLSPASCQCCRRAACQ